MTVICDISNIVRHYSENGSYVRNLSNGAVVLASKKSEATAFYCNSTNTFWPLRSAYVGQEKYLTYEVEEVPEGADVGITRYNNGVLEIDEELKTAVEAEEAAAKKQEKMNESAILAAKIIAEQQTDEATMLMLADLYEAWAPNRQYKAKKIISYGVDAYGDTQLYQVVQDHTSADYWLPDATPSMYAPIGVTEDGYLEWRQPYGSTDAYDIGDIVSYNGQLWKCTGGDGAGKNSWAPGVYGWELYTPDSGETTDPAPEPEPEPGTEPDPETPSYEEWQSGQVHKIGDIVSHNGKLWVCTQGDGAGNNSWEPGVYGWEEYPQE